MTAESTVRARSLLCPPGNVVERDGYLDVLDAEPARTRTQRIFNSGGFASIYANAFRPLVFAATGAGTFRDDLQRARTALHLQRGHLLLDICCGPGNFTHPLACDLSPDGLAIGLDLSAEMLKKAAHADETTSSAFVRGDAQSLPFGNNTFDAVYCAAALDLVPDAAAVITEMIRVLRPGGRITVATTYHGHSTIAQHASTAIGRIAGFRIYDGTTFPALWKDLGLQEIRHTIRGFHQYLDATKPR